MFDFEDDRTDRLQMTHGVPHACNTQISRSREQRSSSVWLHIHGQKARFDANNN